MSDPTAATTRPDYAAALLRILERVEPLRRRECSELPDAAGRVLADPAGVRSLIRKSLTRHR